MNNNINIYGQILSDDGIKRQESLNAAIVDIQKQHLESIKNLDKEFRSKKSLAQEAIDTKLKKLREIAKDVPQDIIEKAKAKEREAIKKDIAMRIEEMQVKTKQDLLRKKHDEIIKNETQITHASDLENLRIVAEAEKFYQEMMTTQQ